MLSALSTATIPTHCPCPIPKAALETAAIIASSTPSINFVQRISLSTTTAPLPPSLPQSHPGGKHHCMPLQERPTLYQTLSSSTSSLSSHSKEQQSTTTQKEPLPPTTTAVTVTAKNLPTITAVATPIKPPLTNKKNSNLILRSGKWTPEEETYANILIELFETGEVDKFEHHLRNNHINNIREKEEYQQQQQKHLPHNTEISNGMTLRSYLSRKLFCSPMRISKKFAGKGIGKRVYMSRNPSNICYHQRFPFTPGSIGAGGTMTVSNTNNSTTSSTSVNPTLPFPHPFDSSLLPLSSSSTVEHWNRLNRLKEAESKFCDVAFPNDDLMEAVSLFHQSIICCNIETLCAIKNSSLITSLTSPLFFFYNALRLLFNFMVFLVHEEKNSSGTIESCLYSICGPNHCRICCRFTTNDNFYAQTEEH